MKQLYFMFIVVYTLLSTSLASTKIDGEKTDQIVQDSNNFKIEASTETNRKPELYLTSLKSIIKNLYDTVIGQTVPAVPVINPNESYPRPSTWGKCELTFCP